VSTTTLKNQIANTNEKIKELKNQVKGFAEVVKPEPIEISDFDTSIEEIESQIKENTPKLTETEVAENNEIYTKIDLLQKEQFGEFKAIELKPLKNVENLKNKLNEVLSRQFNANEINLKIDSLQKKLSKIVALKNALSGSGCSTCSLCTLEDCPSRAVGGKSIESIQFELDMMEDKDVVILQEKIESLIVQKKNAETEFEQAKEAEKTEIEAEIAKIEAENAEIEAENAEIEAENATKLEDHNSRKLSFEANKEEKIKELKNRINFAKQVNNNDLYEELSVLRSKKNAQQDLIDEFNKKMGAFENAKKQIEMKNSEIEKLAVVRAEKEREFILQKEAERNYYENLQKQINEKLPENINLFLYTKNKSNDDYSAVFDLTFDDSKYYSQGQRVVSFAKLCEFFQNEVGVKFPIFIDEVGVLDSESIAKISEIKDFIKLQPSNENLKITNQ
jgi:chromosome segregation ATPase